MLGVVALVRIRRSPDLSGAGLATAGIVIGALFSVIVPLQARRVAMDFVRFHARAKQSECRTQLRAAVMAWERRAQEGATLSDRIADLHIAPEPVQRYAYFLGTPLREGEDGNVLSAGPGVDLLFDAVRAAGVRPGSSVEGTVIACAANIDADETIDVWSVATFHRPGARAGELIHHVDDALR